MIRASSFRVILQGIWLILLLCHLCDLHVKKTTAGLLYIVKVKRTALSLVKGTRQHKCSDDRKNRQPFPSKIQNHSPIVHMVYHIHLSHHQHYGSSGSSRLAIACLSAGGRVLDVDGWPWLPSKPLHQLGGLAIHQSLFHLLGPPITSLSSSYSFPTISISPFLFGHLSHGWSSSLHPPFFQSPLKFIGFRGGLPVLPPVGNRDQRIHYSDRDGCRPLCGVPITRISKRGSPLF